MKVFILGIVFFISHYSLAAPRCADVFVQQPESQPEMLSYNPLGESDLDTQEAAKYSSHNILAYRKYKILLQAHPQLATSPLHEGILSVLKDESLSSFHIMLEKIFANLVKSPSADVIAKFKNKVHEEIIKFMPEDKAAVRVRLLDKTKINKENMMNALGRMTFQESLEALIGSGGIRDLHGDNLVSRYLDQARAKGFNVQTYIGTFPKGPDYKGRGGEKLFISVDRSTVSILDAIISDNPHLLMHNHGRGQGTLQIRHKGMNATYSQYDTKASFQRVFQYNYSGYNYIIPVIPLSSTEASQAINYFDLGKKEKKFAKYPWGFKKMDEKNQQIESYCKTGGYGSCTHWIGEMPIGDKLVTEYSVPGYVGDDVYGHGLRESGDIEDSALRTSKVGEYNTFVSNSGGKTIGFVKRTHRLARMIWLQGMGREQLWSMIGDKNAQGLSRGEWANPGWVLYNFLTRSTQERVPVVFLFREDASERITKKTLDDWREAISPR